MEASGEPNLCGQVWIAAFWPLLVVSELVLKRLTVKDATWMLRSIVWFSGHVARMVGACCSMNAAVFESMTLRPPSLFCACLHSVRQAHGLAHGRQDTCKIVSALRYPGAGLSQQIRLARVFRPWVLLLFLVAALLIMMVFCFQCAGVSCIPASQISLMCWLDVPPNACGLQEVSCALRTRPMAAGW